MCRRSNGPPRIKKEDPIASKQMSLLPTGISKLKAALRGAIESSNAVKDLVLQTAVAESRLDKSVKSNSPSCAALVPSFGKISSNQKLQSPLLKSPLIVKMGIKRRKFEDSGSSDSDIDSDQEEENDASEEDLVPVAPTRRSTRSTRSRKSYKEIGSSDDEDQEQPEVRASGEQRLWLFSRNCATFLLVEVFVLNWLICKISQIVVQCGNNFV